MTQAQMKERILRDRGISFRRKGNAIEIDHNGVDKTPMMLYLERHFNMPIEELVAQPLSLRKLAHRLATPDYQINYLTLWRWQQKLLPEHSITKFVNQYHQ